VATIPFIRMDRNAGALLSGHAQPSRAEVLAAPQTPVVK
jgi:hypothetical protein